MLEKLKILQNRFNELSELLTQAEVISDQSRYIKISKEYKDLNIIVDKKNEYEEVILNINEAKEKANVEADKIISSARKQIANEKMKAITELKNSVAVLSIDIAERVLKSELKDKQTQEEFVSKALKNSELN